MAAEQGCAERALERLETARQRAADSHERTARLSPNFDTG
jgi:hypothetical protein